MLIFLIPVLADYMETGLVARFPTLIVCGFTAIAAILSIFAGLIMNSMAHDSKMEFEYRLQQVKTEYHLLKEKENG